MPKIVNGTRRVPRGVDWYDRPYDILLKLCPRWATNEYIPKVIKALSNDLPADRKERKAEVKRRAAAVKAQIDAQVLRLLVRIQKHRLATAAATATQEQPGGGAGGFFRRRSSSGARTMFRGGGSATSASGYSALDADSEDDDDSEDEASAPRAIDPVEAAKDMMRRWEDLVVEGKQLWPDKKQEEEQGEGSGGGGGGGQEQQQAPRRQLLDILGTGTYLKTRCKETLPDLLTLYRAMAAIPGSAAQIERDQGRCLDYMTRKRASMDPKWMEICSIIDSHRRDTDIDLSAVKKRTPPELEAGLPRVVREPDAWVFRQQDLGDEFFVDFDVGAAMGGGAGAEEEKENDGEWEEEQDVEGEPLRGDEDTAGDVDLEGDNMIYFTDFDVDDDDEEEEE